MTYNEKKQFLEGYISSIKRIKGLQREIEEWETIATNVTQKLSQTNVRSNEINSKVENCAIKISEIQRYLIEEIEEAEYNRKIISDAINGIKDTRRRDLIEMRYVHCVPVRIIADDMNKCTDDIYKMIRKTVRKMEIDISSPT